MQKQFKPLLAGYTKFDEVTRDKCGVLFLVKHIYMRFKCALNIYVFVNASVIFHRIRALNRSITTSININTALLYWYILRSSNRRVVRYIYLTYSVDWLHFYVQKAFSRKQFKKANDCCCLTKIVTHDYLVYQICTILHFNGKSKNCGLKSMWIIIWKTFHRF